jgi:hypothetical protein
MNDIRASGKQEVKAKGIKRKRANPVSALLARGRNLKGVKGEFYPCKPDIFKMTYEEVT